MFLLSACYEEPLTKGIITVYDSEGNTVQGVEVTLTQEQVPGAAQTNVVDIQTSDYKGQTEHVLELEAIMNVDAILKANQDTLMYGQTVIRFTHGKTVYKNVEVVTY